MKAMVVALGLVSFGLAGHGCSPQLAVQIASGPQAFAVDTAQLGLPTELRDPQGMVARVPCQGTCLPTTTITLACENNVCDPAPYEVSAPVGAAIDMASLLQGVGRSLSDVSVLEIVQTALLVNANSMNVALPPARIFIGPDTATGPSDAGVSPFADLASIGAGATGAQTLTMLPSGGPALNTLGRTGNGRFRFFLRTTFDLAPGEPIPMGALEGSVNVTIRVRTNVSI